MIGTLNPGDTLTRPQLFSDNRTVERAVAAEISDQHPSETLLWIQFPQPDGGLRLYDVWTEGGEQLGDRVDSHAVSAGMDAADWLFMSNLHEQITYRGKVRVLAYPLRPVWRDVQEGLRASEERREGVRRVMRAAARHTGRTPRTLTPRWVGFGPGLRKPGPH